MLALYRPCSPVGKLFIVVLNMSSHCWHGGKIRGNMDFLTCNSLKDSGLLKQLAGTASGSQKGHECSSLKFFHGVPAILDLLNQARINLLHRVCLSFDGVS